MLHIQFDESEKSFMNGQMETPALDYRLINLIQGVMGKLILRGKTLAQEIKKYVVDVLCVP